MKISLLEPIGIPEEMVRELAAGFEQEGTASRITIRRPRMWRN